jgi:hypothetical protein
MFVSIPSLDPILQCLLPAFISSDGRRTLGACYDGKNPAPIARRDDQFRTHWVKFHATRGSQQIGFVEDKRGETALHGSRNSRM